MNNRALVLEQANTYVLPEQTDTIMVSRNWQGDVINRDRNQRQVFLISGPFFNRIPKRVKKQVI